MKILKYGIISIWSMIYLCIGITFADPDMYIAHIWLANNEQTLSQFALPRIKIAIGNNGISAVQNNAVGSGFVKCTANGTAAFNSPYLGGIYIATSGYRNANNIQLPNGLTQSAPNTITIQCTIDPTQAGITNDSNILNNTSWFTVAVVTAPQGRFDVTLERSIQTIQSNLDAAEASPGTQWIVNFVKKNVLNIVIPIIIIIGVLIAIIGFYKMMFSDSEEGTTEWSKYLIRWIVGIVIMVSARYLANDVLFNNVLSGGNLATFNGIDVAKILYEQAVFPFVKIAMYLALGILFVIVVSRVIKYLTSPSEEVQKQAMTMIARNVIGIVVILASKQIVELILGTETQVMDNTAQNLGDIWVGVFNGNLPILYTIINRVMWLSAFVVLVIILFQTYQLLVNPTNEETMTKIKHSFLYIAIGIIVIWAWYVITNFLIIN